MNIDARTLFLFDLISGLISCWCWLPISTPNANKSLKSIKLYHSNSKIGFWQSTSDFDSIWKPFGLHLGVENPPTSQNIAFTRGIKNLSDFDIDAYWILALFWRPCWSHVRHQDAPKTAQEPPKMPSEGVWEASWSQEPPKRRPDPLQDSILDPSWPRC